jgi:hypothetical protein
MAEETNFASLADLSADIDARGPRFQMGVFVAPARAVQDPGLSDEILRSVRQKLG